MLSEHHAYYEQFRDAEGRFDDDVEWAIRENAPDGQDVEYEVDYLFDNLDWLTPDYALKATA